VSGLVCGLIPALALFDSQSWDRDQLAGAVLFAFAALVLGGVGLAHQPHGQGLAIAALVLGALGLLGAIGTQV
jgi:peptidoglycan/LPS O-acetylase OafA/YrhL